MKNENRVLGRLMAVELSHAEIQHVNGAGFHVVLEGSTKCTYTNAGHGTREVDACDAD